MKNRIYFGFQIHLDHHLRHAIRYGGYTQPSGSPISFGYVYRAYRRRKITARGHPIPDLIKIVLKTNLKILDRLPIDSRSPLVRLYPTIGFPYHLFGNTKRLCFSNRLLPSLVDHIAKTRQHNPFAPSALHRFRHYYGLFRPRVPHWYSHACGASTCVSPLTSGRQVPTFRTEAWIKFMPSLCRTPPRQYTGPL